MKKSHKALIAIVSILIVALPVFFGATPNGKALWNNWFFKVLEADDVTNYETIKEVENTCRAMISSYNADKLTYQQYKNSDETEKQGWAEQAKMRANKTASTYNNYILQNSFVWRDNVPSDIFMELSYLE